MCHPSVYLLGLEDLIIIIIIIIIIITKAWFCDVLPAWKMRWENFFQIFR